MESGGVRWSSDVGQADWIAERLRPWSIRPHGDDDALTVATVVPAGFESYTRLLHPAGRRETGDYRVRVWNGFGWDSAGSAAARLVAMTGEPSDARFVPPADPVPPAVRGGPLVHLPHRDYFLYRGSAAAVTALALAGREQTANLWWPADHAWCVATEIDLRSTYVGGPAALADALGGDARIEALRALPDDPVSLVLEDWVAAWVGDLTNTLLAQGEAVLTTSRGTVRARLRQSRNDSASLHIEVNGDDGSWSGSDGRPGSSDSQELRRHISFHLTHAILSLAPE